MDNFVRELVAIAAEPACMWPGMDELGYLAKSSQKPTILANSLQTQEMEPWTGKGIDSKGDRGKSWCQWEDLCISPSKQCSIHRLSFNGWSKRWNWSYSLGACDTFKPSYNYDKLKNVFDVTSWQNDQGLRNPSDMSLTIYNKPICLFSTATKRELRSLREMGLKLPQNRLARGIDHHRHILDSSSVKK